MKLVDNVFQDFCILLGFYLLLLLIFVRGAPKSPKLIMDMSDSPFNFLSFCFIELEVLLLNAYTVRDGMSYCLIALFIIMKCPRFFLVVFLDLKSICLILTESLQLSFNPCQHNISFCILLFYSTFFFILKWFHLDKLKLDLTFLSSKD